jgi:hypothetical protein
MATELPAFTGLGETVACNFIPHMALFRPMLWTPVLASTPNTLGVASRAVDGVEDEASAIKGAVVILFASIALAAMAK